MAQRVFIYGAGRIGRSLGKAIQERGKQHGLELFGAWNRSFQRALQTSLILDTEVSSGDLLPEQLLKSNIIILSITDDAIPKLAEGLSRHLSHKHVLLHTSGALPSSAMALGQMKARLGGCHPLQSIPRDDGDFALYSGATFAVEGHPDAVEAARCVAVCAGGEPITILPKGKVYYHAAAVFSANYMTVLTDAARVLYEEAGLDTRTAIRTLIPLLQGTLQNIAAAVEEDTEAPDIAAALTGPIRRGDTKTVSRHVKALRKLAKKSPEASELPELYLALGRRAVTIAERAGLEQEAAQRLSRALGKKPTT